MDNMSYRNNRAAQAPQDSGSPASQPAPQARTKHSHGKVPKPRRKLAIAAAVIFVMLLVVAAWFLLGRSGVSSAIDGSKYQAVFFTNGQVYFGKLSQLNDEYMRLKNVYYLQNKEQADETSPQSASSQDASDVELIKLGNEIHGPEDEMLVAKDQILFFENLKPTGTVSKTITDFQKK